MSGRRIMGIKAPPEPPAPAPAQLRAQETQARILERQEADQARLDRERDATDRERDATERARRGRMGGRSLLMLDEIGFLDGQRPLQNTLGG